jgi:hypothetical protein
VEDHLEGRVVQTVLWGIPVKSVSRHAVVVTRKVITVYRLCGFAYWGWGC